MSGGLPQLPSFLRRPAAQGWLGMAGESYEDMTTGARNEASNKEQAVRDANAKAIADASAAQENATAQAQASITNKKRAIARSRSVYTSPLGVQEQAAVAKKILLGE